MTTEIGFMIPGPDEHGLRLGIGTKFYERHGAIAVIYLGAPFFSIVDSVAIALPNITAPLPTSFYSMPLTLLIPLTSLPSFILWVMTLD
jgi:hypothetical protein